VVWEEGVGQPIGAHLERWQLEQAWGPGMEVKGPCRRSPLPQESKQELERRKVPPNLGSL